MTTYRFPTEADRKDPEHLRRVYTIKMDLASTIAKHATGTAKAKHLAKVAYWQSMIDAL